MQSVIKAGGSIEAIEIERGYGDEWKDREAYWIAWYRFIMGPKLTNLTDDGEGSIGYIPTEETRIKISISGKGKTGKYERTPEWRKQVGDRSRGRKHTAAAKAKCAESSRGRLHTQESKEKMSIAQRGRTFTDEARARISESLKKHFSNPENLEAMRQRQIGKTLSEEHKAAIGRGVVKAFSEISLKDCRL